MIIVQLQWLHQEQIFLIHNRFRFLPYKKCRIRQKCLGALGWSRRMCCTRSLDAPPQDCIYIAANHLAGYSLQHRPPRSHHVQAGKFLHHIIYSVTNKTKTYYTTCLIFPRKSRLAVIQSMLN